MIELQQATQSLSAVDARAPWWSAFRLVDELAVEPLVVSLSVVMTQILSQSIPKRFFAEENQPIETFAFYRKHPAFGERIQIR